MRNLQGPRGRWSDIKIKTNNDVVDIRRPALSTIHRKDEEEPRVLELDGPRDLGEPRSKPGGQPIQWVVCTPGRLRHRVSSGRVLVVPF